MTTEQLRTFCLELKGTKEDVKWEDHLCFLIGGKMYCVTGFSDSDNVSLKVKDEQFDALCEREGIIPAPYMARSKWISVTDRKSLSAKEWKDYIRQSYSMIAAKLTQKARKELGIKN
jgi:predicted DNA-binding protein (MmcQ/YjbR family)